MKLAICVKCWQTYPLADEVRCSHCDIQLISNGKPTFHEAPRASSSFMWDYVPEDPAVVALRRERYRIHRAYLAALTLMEAQIEYPPTRIRSLRGMDRLLQAIFGKKRDKNATIIHWGLPAHAVARAHLARAWP